LEIDGASNNNVEQVRDLRETVGYSTAQSRYRVIIIDEVHMLSRPAFNALLKTLEEPPSHVVFIFATTEAIKIPATVQSRCQRYDFRRLTLTQIRTQLAMICGAENVDVDAAGLDLIAEYADGAMRDGQSLLDQVIASAEGHITSEQVADLIGAVERNVYFGLFDAIASKDIPATIAVVTDTMSRGRSLSQFLAGLMSHLRNLLACSVGAESAISDLQQEDRVKLAEQAGRFTDRDLLRMLTIAADTESFLEKAAVPQVRVELALLKMLYMESSIELADLVGRIGALTADLGIRPPQPVARGPAPEESHRQTTKPPRASGAVHQAAPLPSPADSEPPQLAPLPPPHQGIPTIAALTARWQEVTERLKEDSTLPPWFHQIQPTAIVGETLVLDAANEFVADRVSRIKDGLLSAVRQRFPDLRAVDVHIPTRAKRPAASEAVQRAGSLVQGVVEEEPIVGKLIDALGLELME
jgi:DNA polymerase-3 subunit gamma/tau